MSYCGFIEDHLSDDLYAEVRARWLERNWGRYPSREEAVAAFDRRWSNVTGFLDWTAGQGAVIADAEMDNAGARLNEVLNAAFPRMNHLPCRRRPQKRRAK